ncbi:glycosyltransferase family 2 protein [Lactiplantibacillus plantarum]|uniref:glycosyltransferase family 2 protein n=1 Tax=Lactiplantibacillus plantarum TaxID=1590 RepID=UPI001432EE5F|nr:glycosyltransferase family 2 protein [Lactiplantibacillus plantarum]MCT3242473.1 glycosyltransferase [Lactiplantibacillus plantarum]
MNEPLVSIIVPTYNSADTIKTCIDSILSQTFTDFVVFIIDDGSSDGTLEVLNGYQLNTRINIMSQDNNGVSVARNNALSKVTTKYVTFVDSDDYVDSKWLEVLVAGFSNSNIVLSTVGVKEIYSDGRVKLRDYFSNVYSNEEAISTLMSENGPQGYLVNKLFLTSIIKKNKIKLDKDLFMAEDLNFVTRYIVKAKNKVAVNNSPLYNYIIRNGSANGIRLTALQSNYEETFDNFMLSMSKIRASLPNSYTLAQDSCDLMEGQIAINYMRAMQLMRSSDRKKWSRMRSLAKKNRALYFRTADISVKKKLIYLLMLFSPIVVKFLDQRRS